MSLNKPFRFLNDLEDVLTSYNEGQKENSQNNNLILSGIPRTGKGQVSGWGKEHGMAGDHVKLFEVHASKISHLAEILQFLFPNGFFLNRDSRGVIESVQNELKKGSYTDPVTSKQEIRDLLKLHDEGSPPERIEKLEELIGSEENYSLKQRLNEALQKQKEIQARLKQTHKWCYTNGDAPDTFRENYTDGLNDAFTAKVFTPISKGMPTGDVPDFFEPFAVPVDDFERYEQLKWSLQIIHPDRFDQYKDFYGRVVDVGDTSFEDLKNVDELKKSDHFVTKEYGDGEEFQVTRVRNEKNIKEKFQRDWDGTFTEGVVCSSSFDYKLRPRLKEAMLSDEPDVVALYTGFISDETLRKFVMVYFMETMFDIVRNLSGDELKKLDKQFIASLIEAQEVVKKSTKSNSLNNADRVFNRFIWEAMNDSGHYNFNFWFDTKPSETHPNLLSKTSKRVITRMNKESVRSWYSGSGPRDSILKAFQSTDYRKLDKSYPEFGYGFIYDDDVVDWEDRYGVKKYGHRLPCPRMCVQDPVDQISNSDWSFFTEELGFDSMRFKEFQDALFKEDWEANAEPYVEERKRQAEKEAEEEAEEEQTRKQMLQNLACEKLRSRVNELGEVPSTWTSHAKQILEDLHDEGLAEEWEHHRNVMDATLDLRKDLEENFEAGDGVDGVDVYEVKDEIKRIEKNGVPVFINENLASKSKKRRMAKRFILENYDVGEDGAEELAEEATDEAILDLQMDEVIDSNLRPVDEYAEDPENYWSYLGEDSSSDDSSQASSDDEASTDDVDSQEDGCAEDHTEYEFVRVTSEIPEFRGTDLDVYGPFEEDKVVEVPADNAEILVNRDNAEYVDGGEASTDSQEEEEEGDVDDDLLVPESDWLCTCGTWNEEDRLVCLKCTKSYEEVEEETESS